MLLFPHIEVLLKYNKKETTGVSLPDGFAFVIT